MNMNISTLRYTLPLIALLAVLATGCDKTVNPVEQDPGDERVAVLTASQVFQSENNIIVDGQVVYSSPFRPDSSFNIHDESSYTYNYQLDQISFEWITNFVGVNIDLNKTPRLTGAPSSTNKFIFDNLDLGEITLNGVPVESLTEEDVDFGGIADSLIEIRQFKVYHHPLFQSRINSQGNVFVDHNTSLNEAYENNEGLVLSGSNSSEVDNFTHLLPFRKTPKISSINNGVDLDFMAAIPRITAKNDLKITFDQPLKAGQSFMVFIPISTDGSSGIRFSDVREKAIFVSIINDTDQILLTAEKLQEIKRNSTVASEGYQIFINSTTHHSDLTFETVNGESYTFPVFTQGLMHLFVLFNE